MFATKIEQLGSWITLSSPVGQQGANKFCVIRKHKAGFSDLATDVFEILLLLICMDMTV